MGSLPNIHHSHLSLIHFSPQPALKFCHSSFPSPFSSLYPPLPRFSLIRASSSPSPSPLPSRLPSHKPQNPFAQLLQTLNPLVKPTCVAIAATAFFLTRLQFPPLAAASAPVSPSDSAASETLPNESASVEQLRTDVEALQSLLPAKIRAGEIGEAIRVLDRLIELEPEEMEYEILKAHLHIRHGEPELAENGFENLLNKDPLDVEAYRGLLMLFSETDKPTGELLKRLEEAVKVCKEQERFSDAREFKLLIAQLKIIDEDLSAALKVYEELVKEEPKDFRPYFCQGIVYTILKKEDEAEKHFEKYRTLVPEDHPCKKYFGDNTKILEMGFLERRGVGAES